MIVFAESNSTYCRVIAIHNFICVYLDLDKSYPKPQLTLMLPVDEYHQQGPVDDIWQR